MDILRKLIALNCLLLLLFVLSCDSGSFKADQFNDEGGPPTFHFSAGCPLVLTEDGFLNHSSGSLFGMELISSGSGNVSGVSFASSNSDSNEELKANPSLAVVGGLEITELLAWTKKHSSYSIYTSGGSDGVWHSATVKIHTDEGNWLVTVSQQLQ